MLLDGKKVACATCIKGHRATHCKHKDRPMVEIKKIGRPSTQCERCRALRLVRQLHVKCNCGEERPLKRTVPTHDDRDRKKRVLANLRVIAPRQKDTMDGHQQQQTTVTTQPPPATSISSPTKSCCSSSQNVSLPQKPKNNNNNKVSSPSQGTPDSSCCGSQSTAGAISSSPTNETTTTPSPPPLTRTPSSSSCCPSSTTTHKLGRPIRLVTCRCGDACTCIGCDAHPARAMKSYHDHDQQQQQQPHPDPYAGYSDLSLGRRRLSIAAICQPPSPPSPSSSSSSSSSTSSSSPLNLNDTSNDDRPTSVLAENGALLCGCGCSHALDQCTDCFQELCQDYFASR